MLKLKIEGAPVTKKNSQRVFTVGGHLKIMPSKNYKEYEEMALRQLMAQPTPVAPISVPVTVTCVYRMPTHWRVDLVNLLEATDDILTRARIIEDEDELRRAANAVGAKYSKGFEDLYMQETEDTIRAGRLCCVEITIEHMTGKIGLELLKERRRGEAAE